MDKPSKSVERKSGKARYVTPAMKKHEPIKILQGSEAGDYGGGGSGGCSGLYYVILYYWY